MLEDAQSVLNGIYSLGKPDRSSVVLPKETCPDSVDLVASRQRSRTTPVTG
jgi:hypothetical protein